MPGRDRARVNAGLAADTDGVAGTVPAHALDPVRDHVRVRRIAWTHGLQCRSAGATLTRVAALRPGRAGGREDRGTRRLRRDRGRHLVEAEEDMVAVAGSAGAQTALPGAATRGDLREAGARAVAGAGAGAGAPAAGAVRGTVKAHEGGRPGLRGTSRVHARSSHTPTIKKRMKTDLLMMRVRTPETATTDDDEADARDPDPDPGRDPAAKVHRLCRRRPTRRKMRSIPRSLADTVERKCK